MRNLQSSFAPGAGGALASCSHLKLIGFGLYGLQTASKVDCLIFGRVSRARLQAAAAANGAIGAENCRNISTRRRRSRAAARNLPLLSCTRIPFEVENLLPKRRLDAAQIDAPRRPQSTLAAIGAKKLIVENAGVTLIDAAQIALVANFFGNKKRHNRASACNPANRARLRVECDDSIGSSRSLERREIAVL